MAKRNDTQWFLSNLAITGRASKVFDTKEEAILYAVEDSENKEKPFLRINVEDRSVDYRGKVYL